ncbi:MAG: reverse transcriptase domain-containing protein, partial [Acutalibacteraceae bacterium]|nr:reverse transcriptase domain-containing protein [Acutalibacteraceae bacterium]
LMEKILSRENMLSALKAVKRNKGAAGIDKVTVDELDEYFRRNWTEMKTAILEKKYKPQPVRRVYIPKSNGKMRPLGIPTVADRVIQQAVAQELVRIFDTSFSNYSHGFRPQRSCHTAMEQVLQNLNDGYEWVVDLDIEKYFDTVNHDKLISILRERVNDATTLHLVRGFLKAGVMENGVICQNDEGVPQGGLCKARHKPPYAEQDIMRRKADLQAYILHFQNNNSA